MFGVVRVIPGVFSFSYISVAVTFILYLNCKTGAGRIVSSSQDAELARIPVTSLESGDSDNYHLVAQKL